MSKKNKTALTILISIVPAILEGVVKIMDQKNETKKPMTKEEYKLEMQKNKNQAKKERLELKHKYKMELLEKKNKFLEENNEEIEEKKYKITGTLLFFTYGIATISATQDLKIMSTLIGLAQVVMIELPILSDEGVLNISKRTQRILFYTSILLIIPFIAFRN